MSDNVRYTTLSSQNLYNMAEDSHAYRHHKDASQDAFNQLKNARRSGASESRLNAFRNAAQDNAVAAGESKINWTSATSGMNSTGNFDKPSNHPGDYGSEFN